VTRGGLGLFRPVALTLIVGVLVLAGVGRILHLSTSAGSNRGYHRMQLSGRQANPLTLHAVASAIAGRPVTVVCQDHLFDVGHAGEVQMGSDTETLDTYVCVDLGHFAAVPKSELACAASNPHALCPGTISQVLDSMHVLAHESLHLHGYADEALTDCFARQFVAQVAIGFGAERDLAHKLLHYYNDHFDEIRRPSPTYVSAQCHARGALDLRPETASWPD
jgi:hypothetical protein